MKTRSQLKDAEKTTEQKLGAPKGIMKKRDRKISDKPYFLRSLVKHVRFIEPSEEDKPRAKL